MISRSSTYNRKKVALVFLVIFAVFVFTPSVVAVVKSQVDISMFYSFVEEEETSETKENSKTVKEKLIRGLEDWRAAITYSSEKGNIDFHRERLYTFELADQFCPPPENS